MLASIAILALFGILLIVLETFLPGWVAGILGVVSISAAVWLGLTSEELVGWSTGQRVALVLAILVLSVAVIITWLRWFAVKFLRRALTLTTSIETPHAASVPPGSRGVALTQLRPLGRAEIHGHRFDVRCQSGLAEAGAPVEVIATEPGNLLVRII
ncbi:NfeD family protein [Prosthecobacter vanneervenii]|uniref:Membrane-bound serine protease (ClpP class) n=1 Tax=Prosthecobacter vanneervenii TaxID=48466 RepID=A0A7W8DI05_9BACT|nr:NfeD family protein [Prosthecobacter vanneervenii]MBB5030512.1 membrane-bound serine protease (ClpP class) [Prosthecobacter vanneervenii]